MRPISPRGGFRRGGGRGGGGPRGRGGRGRGRGRADVESLTGIFCLSISSNFIVLSFIWRTENKVKHLARVSW